MPTQYQTSTLNPHYLLISSIMMPQTYLNPIIKLLLMILYSITINQKNLSAEIVYTLIPFTLSSKSFWYRFHNCKSSHQMINDIFVPFLTITRDIFSAHERWLLYTNRRQKFIAITCLKDICDRLFLTEALLIMVSDLGMLIVKVRKDFSSC